METIYVVMIRDKNGDFIIYEYYDEEAKAQELIDRSVRQGKADQFKLVYFDRRK